MRTLGRCAAPRRPWVVTWLALAVALSGGAAAARAATSTGLADVDPSGGTLPHGATDVTMTPDGRYVAFVTTDAIDPNGTNGVADVYLRDRRTGTVTRISAPPGDGPVDGPSSHPSISADGTKVAFESLADNLVAGDNNGGADVFVRDLTRGTTTLASVRLDGSLAGPGGSVTDVMAPVISADGTTVAFKAPEFAIKTGGDNAYHVFARNLAAPGSEAIDVTPSGGEPNAPVANAGGPSISADGRYVALASGASDIVAGDTNAHIDVFVRDRTTETTQRASVSSSGGEGTGGDALSPVISGDGSTVAFEDSAPNLVQGDIDGVTNVFARDLVHGQTTMASPEGTAAHSPQISTDGRYVAYTKTGDVFVVDRNTGPPATQVSTGGGATPDALGATGRHVLFDTLQALVPADNNGASDGYLFDSGVNTPPVAKLSVQPGGGLTVNVDGSASYDPDGWITKYSWSFGDGGTTTGPRGPYTFRAPGRYAVVLTVTDSDGATSTTSGTVDVAATGSDGGTTGGTPGGTQTTGSQGTPARPPRNRRRPRVRGAPHPGMRLTCDPGLWDGHPRFAYRWLRDGRPVKRATARRYRVARSDLRHNLACRVTARLAGHPAGVATSKAVRVTRARPVRRHRRRR